MSKFIVGLICFSLGVVGTGYFYHKLTGAWAMAWMNSQSFYLGCTMKSIEDGNSKDNTQNRCQALTQPFYDKLVKYFQVIGETK